MVAQVLVDGQHRTLSGQGNGPVAALVDGIRAELGIELSVEDYHEHALTAGSEASRRRLRRRPPEPDGEQVWGSGSTRASSTPRWRPSSAPPTASGTGPEAGPA